MFLQSLQDSAFGASGLHSGHPGLLGVCCSTSAFTEKPLKQYKINRALRDKLQSTVFYVLKKGFSVGKCIADTLTDHMVTMVERVVTNGA